ncbi:MAG: zinc ribbon domain-containing protein [Candidatus Dormibacteraceae bacterium]
MSSSPPELPFCIECGARLAAGARLCPTCGTERWTPGAPGRPAPDAEKPLSPRADRQLAPADIEATVASVPWIYAFGAVLNVALLAWALAEGTTTGGQANWDSFLTQARVPISARTGLVVSLCIVFLLSAAGHAIAFHGLRAKKRWGWIVGIVLATLWSIVIMGIPVLVRLAQRQVRAAYGVS